MINEIDDLVRPDIHSSSMAYRQRFSGGVGAWFLETQNRITQAFIVSHLTNNPGAKANIVDFGGGHGQNIAVCNALEVKLTIQGSDESCFQLIDQEHPQAGYAKHVGSLLESGLADNSYAIALSYRMLPHLEDWQSHVSELCRVAQYSVIVEFPSRKSINLLSDKLFALKKGVEGNTRKFVLFDIDSVAAEFQKNGFRLDGVKGQYLWPMVLHRMLKSKTISEMLEKVAGIILPRAKFGSPLICKFSAI